MDLCLINMNGHFQLTCKEIDNHKLSCCSAVREGDIVIYVVPDRKSEEVADVVRDRRAT